MTLQEFMKNGFSVNELIEVEGRFYYIEKCRNGRYFNSCIGGKQITRATATRIRNEIIADVKSNM